MAIDAAFLAPFFEGGAVPTNAPQIQEGIVVFYNHQLTLLFAALVRFAKERVEVRAAWLKALQPLKTRLMVTPEVVQKAEDRLSFWLNTLLPTKWITPSKHKKGLRFHEKFAVWSLPPLTANMAIVGDSNLARIPPFKHASAQVESYPGATIEHLVHLFKTYQAGVAPSKLIISVGVNNLGRKIVAGFQAIREALPAAFGKTKVFFVELQVARCQRASMHAGAAQLNLAAREAGLNILPSIPSLQTGPDQIHWTEHTAQELLEHWLRLTEE